MLLIKFVQGATRAKREARFKDPSRRLRKLQEQVCVGVCVVYVC
jgi:hypothetical protein